jgi:hypothetical protein
VIARSAAYVCTAKRPEFLHIRHRRVALTRDAKANEALGLVL